MTQLFDGIHLLGRFGKLKTGSWILSHGADAAVLEVPPWLPSQRSPADAAQEAVKHLAVSVKYIFCTHVHGDHFCPKSFDQMRNAFPTAQVVLQSGFRPEVKNAQSVQWFDDHQSLDLNGEPLFLVHAPKHNSTDTMIIFRGAVCTGDWELNTIRTVNELVPVATRQRSIQKMIDFVTERHYAIHRTFSVHANDRREGVDFVGLMEDTRVDRKLW